MQGPYRLFESALELVMDLHFGVAREHGDFCQIEERLETSSTVPAIDCRERFRVVYKD